ncbi:hypothetical protein HaLaN_03960 [Haematococcus lacustris]|uniref:Uncharacterized protein n=1 Tax=Haematococcus lacustris TaxID=44745 RepID=A0A699YPQ5_HAELA|nr:hypothetical protein HaLaN_03960 [Haematococcus lacustris]
MCKRTAARSSAPVGKEKLQNRKSLSQLTVQHHVTVQSSATVAGGTSQGSIRDHCHTHVSVANPSTQQDTRAQTHGLQLAAQGATPKLSDRTLLQHQQSLTCTDMHQLSDAPFVVRAAIYRAVGCGTGGCGTSMTHGHVTHLV